MRAVARTGITQTQPIPTIRPSSASVVSTSLRRASDFVSTLARVRASARRTGQISVRTSPHEFRGLAAGASLLAISLLWPAPARNPLRDATIAACRAIAARLRAQITSAVGTSNPDAERVRDQAVARSVRLDAAVAGALGTGIDAEDFHASDASISFSSMSKLDQTWRTSSCSSRASISLTICCACLPSSFR